MPISSGTRAFCDLTRDGVAVVDAQLRYRYVNETAAGLVGFDAGALVGVDALQWVHPDDEPSLRALVTELLETVAGATRTDDDAVDRVAETGDDVDDESGCTSAGVAGGVAVEFRHRTAAGEWRRLRGELYPTAGEPVDGVLARVRPAESVASTHPLETLADCSTDVSWIAAPDWSRLQYVDGPVESMLGVDPAAIRRRPRRLLELVHADDRSQIDRAMTQLSAGEATQVDYRIERPDGEVRWLRVPAEPVLEHDQVVAIAGVLRDVTDEYRRNRQLAVMDHLLRHSIRNEMNVVLGTASRIADRASATLAADASSAVHTDVETIRRAATGLLTTAEKQRDVIDLLCRERAPRPVAVEPAVRRAVDAARALEPTGEISSTCPPGATALALPELEDALAELVENAVRHADGRPNVHVDVTVTETTVTVAVADNCPPVPPTERHVIADRWEVDHLRHTAGMGLWLVYWVADRSGGRLSFDTHETGNVVTLSVPATRESAATGGPVESLDGGDTADGDAADGGAATDGGSESADDAGTTR
jgi:PAS domain S-box-containing protein